jgi:hypothetical protein
MSKNKMIRNYLKKSTTFTILLFFLPALAWGQPDIFGTLYIYNPNGPNAIPAVGYLVYIWHPARGKSAPSVTDSFGRYAIYGVPPDRYKLFIINQRLNYTVWEQDVSSPSMVPTIVLPKP